MSLEPCDWDVDYTTVQAYCPRAPEVTDEGGAGTITSGIADAVVAQGLAAVWAATGRRYGVCEYTARACSRCCRSSCRGSCTGDRYDRLDLDPLANRPVAAVDRVTVGSTLLTELDYAVQDGRWLLRRPSGTRWPRIVDIAGDVADLEVTWRAGYPPGEDLRLNAAVPLICELARKAAGERCSIPDEVVSINREGVQFVTIDLESMLRTGTVGPPGVLAAIARDPGSGGVPDSGLALPQDILAPPLTTITGGGALAAVEDEWIRIVGDTWTWDFDAVDLDTTDWTDLVVEIRDGPTHDANLLATTADGSILTTNNDFPSLRIWWQVPSAVTVGIEPGVLWLEAAAVVPAEGGEWTFLPAHKLVVNDQVAT